MRPLLAAVAALSICCQVASAESIDKSFHESFDVQPGATLHLSSGDGDVDIKTWDESRIQIDVEYHYDQHGLHWGKDRKEFNVLFRQDGDHVYVEEERGSGEVSFQIGAVSRREYSYTIQAPAWTELDIEGEDGEIRITNWQASIEIVCDDGDVEILDSQAPRFDLQMEDGDLKLRRCSAAIDVEIDDGDVTFEQVATQALSIAAADGEIDLALVGDGAVDWEVAVDDADLHLEFSGALDADVQIETDEGRIRAETSIASAEQRRESRFSGKLGSGEGRLRLRGQDGDIVLREMATTP
jgi:hypothetical protein